MDESIRESDMNTQRYAEVVTNRELVLSIMRCVEAAINEGIISDALQNSAEPISTQTNRIEDENAAQHLVSTAIVNNVHASLFYHWVFPGPQELQNFSENVNIRELDDLWRGENVELAWINVSNENVSQDYLTTFTFAEDIIVIRYIMDFRNGVHYSAQIIWNSRFSWREIMQHLQENTYNFNFPLEFISIAMNYRREEVASSSAAEVVDGLRDIIILLEDNANGDEVMCVICHENFTNGESAKQLACNHLYHSHCLLQWFSRKFSCPTCRHEPLAPQP